MCGIVDKWNDWRPPIGLDIVCGRIILDRYVRTNGNGPKTYKTTTKQHKSKSRQQLQDYEKVGWSARQVKEQWIISKPEDIEEKLMIMMKT